MAATKHGSQHINIANCNNALAEQCVMRRAGFIFSPRHVLPWRVVRLGCLQERLPSDGAARLLRSKLVKSLPAAGKVTIYDFIIADRTMARKQREECTYTTASVLLWGRSLSPTKLLHDFENLNTQQCHLRVNGPAPILACPTENTAGADNMNIEFSKRYQKPVAPMCLCKSPDLGPVKARVGDAKSPFQIRSRLVVVEAHQGFERVHKTQACKTLRSFDFSYQTYIGNTTITLHRCPEHFAFSGPLR